jgi:EAL domain-containing protein (putative c-di-GMP-specific phosphodiesterase class I)
MATMWAGRGHELQTVVNVSPVQFDMSLGEAVSEILSKTYCDPELISLEITETSLMRNANSAVSTLDDLKKLGISVSIDDFGTGYSSLGHLKNLPIDVLKIDKSFIDDVTTETDDASLVTAMVGLAHNLRLSVVAEGVEKKEQLQFLNQIGCDEWQGYLFSEALSEHHFNRFLERQLSVAPHGV